MVEPVRETVDPVVDMVDETTQPLKETIDPVVDPVDPVVDTVVDTVEPAVDPVVEPVVDLVGPVVDPLDPVGGTPEPDPDAAVAGPVRTEPPMGPTPHDPDGIPARTPETAGATLKPLAAPAVPEEESPGASGGSSLASRLADAAAASSATAQGATSAGVPSPEPAPAASGLPGADPDGPLAPTSRAAIGGHRIPPATPTRGPPPALLPSAGGHHPSMRDLGFGFAASAAARDASYRLPLPLPGAPPAPAPGGASGGGPDLSGALALLLGAALAGRFLWHVRDLLRPLSVFGPIVNQPS